MSDQPARLLPETDFLLEQDKAAVGTALTAYNGGDPLVDPPMTGYPEDMQVEIERRLVLEQDRTAKMNEAVFLNEESGWGQIKQFMDGVFDQYREHNESALIQKPQTEEEAIAQMQQMRPVEVDPNEVANIRQMAVKLDQQMKAIDPRSSFWTDSRTKKYAEWLNREAGVGTAGFMQSGEQPVEMGVVGRSAYAAWQGIEGIADPAMSLVHGAWDLSRRGVQAIGGPDIGPSYPTNYIEGPDGKLYDNGGKAPSMLQGLTMAWAYAANQNIEQAAASAGRMEEWELANREGFGGLVTSVSRLGGELVGMGPAFGAAGMAGKAAMGGLTSKGLQALGTLRLTKGLAQSPRALKIIGAMSKGMGEAAGMAGYESVAYGRMDGYGAAFGHGLMMAPVLMTLGKLGRKTEWFAKNRANMPAVAARGVAGAMEGAGFASVETLAPDLLPTAWGFIRDPNQETWEAYAKNALAFMLVKMGTGRTTRSTPEEMQIRRGIGRAQFAEQVEAGRATPEAVARAPVSDVGKLSELGRASRTAREGRTAEERGKAQELQRKLESELDVVEMGKGPAEARVEAYEGPARPTMEELVTRVREAKTPQERVDALKEVRKREAEQRSDSGGGDQVELDDGERLEFRESPTSAGSKEWIIRTREGEPIGQGSFQVDPKTGRAQIWNAEISEAHRGRGLYSRVLKEMGKRFPQGIESPGGQTEGAKGAWKKAGMELTGESVPRETQQRLGDRRSPAGERSGPQALQQQPTRQVEAEPGVQPVRAKDIYSEMEGREAKRGFRIPFTSVRIGGSKGDKVRVAIRGGKIPGSSRGVLGVFKFHENLMRTQEGRDLAVASHEWSHAMQRHVLAKEGKAFTRESGRQLGQAIKEVPGLADEVAVLLKDYPGAAKLPKAIIWAEAWAEWHARNLLGEVGLDAKLPKISQWMRNWLAKPEQAQLRQQYQRIQDMLYRYNAQGSLERVRQSVVLTSDAPTPTEKATTASPLRRAVRSANKALLDDMADLKASQDKWLRAAGRKPESVSITEDPARLMDALRMTANKTVEHFIMRGMRTPTGRVRGLRDIMGEVKGRERDFVDYIVSVRSMELYKKGKEVQLPPQDYAETIKQMEQRSPDFRERMAELKQWTDGLVDYVQTSGGISAEDAQRIKDAYVVYVPFFRAIEGPKQHGGGRGVAERGTGLSRIKGSTYEIQDPLMSLQQVARSMVAKAHQNQVMSALYKMSAVHEAGGMATVVPKTKIPKTHPVKQLIDAIEKKIGTEDLTDVFEALRDADALNPQTITLFSQKVIPTGERSVIAFTPRLTNAEVADLAGKGASRRSLREQNNKLQWLEVDTKVYESLMGIDKMPQLPESLQPVMQWLQAPRDVVRFFATGVSPGFLAANLLRDAMSAPLFDRKGKFRPLGGFVKAIRGAIIYHGDRNMRELYEMMGVKTASFLSEGRAREVAGQNRRMRDRLLDVADRVQNFFAHPENYIRMAEFKDAYEAAKASGKSEMESRLLALEAGREITVNFARGGVWARAMNQLVPYFNAGLQGQRKLWGQLLVGGTETKGDAAKARVQRGALLNGIANITVPATLLWLLNKDEEWYQDLPQWRKVNYFNFKVGDDIVSLPKPFEAGVVFGALPEIMLDANFGSNPAELKEALRSVGGPYFDGVGALIPAFIKPILEVGTNKNLFTGRPITPEWISRSAPPQEQATFYTTETAKVISRVFNGILTPTEIEHLLAGYTAGASTSALRQIDEIVGVKEHPAAAEPWARFFRQAPHGQSDFVDRLYKMSTDLDQNKETLDPQQRGLKRRVDTAKRRISDLRRAYRAGSINRQEAERRSYEIARPLVEEQK